MSEGSFLVDCPCCKARIEVDRKTGKVLRHWDKPKIKDGADPMEEAMKKMREDKARLEGYFSGARDEMDKKKKDLMEKFEKEKKRIEESGEDIKPINPLDLD